MSRVFPPPRTPPSGPWAETAVRRLRDGRLHDEIDHLALEAPLEIRLGGQAFTVLMRTPGHDEELVGGFLYSEGLVRDAGEIRALAHPESLLAGDCENVIAVELAEAPGQGARDEVRDEVSGQAANARTRIPERTFYASASCGVCGKSSIADLAIQAPVVVSGLRIAAALLETLPDRLRAVQPVFAATGGLHGAALFDTAGKLLAVREDIGRHNAVDKLIGWALGRGLLPLSATVLVVSGRLGFEIVQKAIVAGIPLVAAVGAASSIAVSLAERFGLTLATFVKPGSLNLYGATERVTR
ncbi:MAG: FdhD protein [Acidobacteriota bacterium]|nr:FdhD protein [Acidobacteriota bacterium]